MDIIDECGGNLICGEHAHIPGRVEFVGSGNELVIGNYVSGKDVQILLSNGSRMYVGPHCSMGEFRAFLHNRGRLRIGRECALGAVRFLLNEPSQCCVGRECLFSEGIDVTTSDMHSIIDLSSGNRLNPAEDVYIGSKVWVGKEVLVLKGVRIGSGSVIGARSLVSKPLPSNVVAVGSPARVVRENTSWNFNLLEGALVPKVDS